jgi:sialate O-acetylesterase
MGLALRECFGAPEDIAAADDPQFRFIAVSAVGRPVPAPDIAKGAWRVSTPATAADFAGTAYYFGRSLRRHVKAPIGLIEFAVGATGIEGWVPLTAYRDASAPALQAMYREAAGWDSRSEIGKRAHAEAFAKLEAWLPAAKEALAAGRPTRPPAHAHPTMPGADRA